MPKVFDKTSHSMCLEKKEESLTDLTVVWMGTRPGDDVAQEAQPFRLGEHSDPATGTLKQETISFLQCAPSEPQTMLK